MAEYEHERQDAADSAEGLVAGDPRAGRPIRLDLHAPRSGGLPGDPLIPAGRRVVLMGCRVYARSGVLMHDGLQPPVQFVELVPLAVCEHDHVRVTSRGTGSGLRLVNST